MKYHQKKKKREKYSSYTTLQQHKLISITRHGLQMFSQWLELWLSFLNQTRSYLYLSTVKNAFPTPITHSHIHCLSGHYPYPIPRVHFTSYYMGAVYTCENESPKVTNYFVHTTSHTLLSKHLKEERSINTQRYKHN